MQCCKYISDPSASKSSASKSNISDTFTLCCGVCFCGELVSCYFALCLAVFLMSLSLALLAVFVFHPSSVSSLKSNSISSVDRSLVVIQLNRYKVLYLFSHMVAQVGVGWCEVACCTGICFLMSMSVEPMHVVC